MPAKRRKKEAVEDGAPAYFALFCSLMTVLLAFFILLTTMADEQESGFHKGIGDIRNAFGLKGGFGLFGYAHMIRGTSDRRVPEELAVDGGVDSIPEEMVSGSGGGGNTDADVQPTKEARYLRITVPNAFEKDSATIPEAMARYLLVAGTTFALLEYHITITCSSGETGDERKDREMALRRAASIMRYLHRSCRLSYTRMRSVGMNAAKAEDAGIVIDLYQPPAGPVKPPAESPSHGK